jgi:hypothetical protein
MEKERKTRDIKVRVSESLFEMVRRIQEQERRPSLSDMTRVLIEDGLKARAQQQGA